MGGCAMGLSVLVSQTGKATSRPLPLASAVAIPHYRSCLFFGCRLIASAARRSPSGTLFHRLSLMTAIICPPGKTYIGHNTIKTRITMSSTSSADPLFNRLRFSQFDWGKMLRSERRSLAREWWQSCTRPCSTWNEAWQYINQRDGMIEPEFLQYRVQP